MILVIAVSGFALLGFTIRQRRAAEQALHREEQRTVQAAAWVAAHRVVFTSATVRPGLNFTTCLQEIGLEAAEVLNVVESARPVFDFRRVRAGNRLTVGRSVAEGLREVEYQIDAERLLRIKPSQGTLRAEVVSIPVTVETAGIFGKIEASLFDAVTEAGEAPELALRLADIFGWDLDFYTDTQPGDTFRLAVEKKKYLNGELAAYGRILAAEYVNGPRTFQAVLFHDPNGKAAYYTPDGKSLQKAFLRSPLKFSAPITSRFSRNRFHPILKRYRPHLGVDYGAPEGTPVQTIAEGRVVSAGYAGEGGKTVHIRHPKGYETYYCHLSRIFVRAGQQVAQGERIGLVGATGLATGPHLDFRLRRHGTFVNFATLTLPPAQPVAKADWAAFVAVRDQWLPLLPNPETVLASTAHKTGVPAKRQNPEVQGSPSVGR